MKYSYWVNSATRNTQQYPEPSKFQYHFSGRKNVSRVTLRRAGIFNSTYIVNKYNKAFKFVVGVSEYSAELDEGNYVPSELAEELETKMNSAMSNTLISVDIDITGTKFTFDASGNTLSFEVDSYPEFAQLVGVTSDVSGSSFTAPNMFQVRPTSFYEIRIREVWSNSESDSFYLLNDEQVSGMLSFDSQPIQSIHTQIGRLDRFTIEIRDEFGNLCDFHGVNVVLDIEIEADN